MATVIKAIGQGSGQVAFPFTDLSRQRESYLDQARAEAAGLITAAQVQADQIRADAQHIGHAAGLASAQRIIDAQAAALVASVEPLLRQITAELTQARQSWLAQWELQAVQLATSIAGRVIRRELERQPDIPLRLVTEALNLVAGKPDIRILLSPGDHRQWGEQVSRLAATMAGVAHAAVVADPSISCGGCRIETRHGTIDQTIEAQLERIQHELTRT